MRNQISKDGPYVASVVPGASISHDSGCPAMLTSADMRSLLKISGSCFNASTFQLFNVENLH